MDKFSNIKILSTRPLREELVHSAAFKGVQIDVAAFIKTQSITNDTTSAIIKQFAQQAITAIFTSMNAVEAVIAQLDYVPEWKVFTLGGITRELVSQYFGENSIEATGKNATNLAQKIVLHNHTQPLVFFSGDQRLDELPEILKANEVEVAELVVYQTILTPISITNQYDAVAFFSPSAVHSFFSENTLPLTTVLFSIGKTTTATIKTYVANPVITSEWPGKEQLIDLAINYFTQS